MVFRVRAFLIALILTTPLGLFAQGHQLADTGSLGAPTNVRPEERMFAELAADAPSAGGFYYDRAGDLVVLVRDKEHDGLALAGAKKLRDSKRIGGGGHAANSGRIRVARADFTFRELSRWRDLAFDHVLGVVPGVMTLDLDETHNRVALGIDPQFAGPGGAEARVRQTLRELGVPSAALTFAPAGRTVNDALTPPFSLLNDSFDPLAGGLEIVLQHNDGTLSGCTLGFAAIRDGVPGMVTASHCTTFMFNPDTDPVFQVFRRVGTAAVDPDAYTCGFRRCRGADAAFIASTGAAPMGVGLIARTTFRNAGDLNGGNGSTIIDQRNPYWYVTGEENDNLFVGENVQKVGITTGWTWGWITQTCIDHWVEGDSVMRCAYEASYVADHGDSGGPVFIIDDQAAGRVTLVGTHSGRDFFSNRPRFAKLSRIKSDLGGAWQVKAPAPPPPTPLGLSARIDGPIVANQNEITSWTGFASGGTAPYSYEWSGFASGSDQSVSASPTDSGDLVLDVFDAAGGHYTVTIHVTVGQNCSPFMIVC